GPQASVQEAMEALIRTTQKEFPIVDGGGRLRGVLTRDAMIRALKEHGPDAPVLDAMDADIPTVPARASLESAVKSFSERGKTVLGVTDAAGRLVGMLTVENLGEMMMLRAARPAARPGTSGASGTPGPWGRA